MAEAQATSQGSGEGDTIVSEPVTPVAVEIDLSALPPEQPWQPGDPIEEIPLGTSVPQESSAAGMGSGTEGVQSSAAPDLASVTPPEFLTPNPNFDGIATVGNIPPDTVGDVGPNHYFQAVNVRFQIYDKQGTSLAGPTNINCLWRANVNCTLPAADGINDNCEANNNGDPYVNYDHLADRWVLSQFAVPNGFGTPPTFQCIAVSQTADPVAGGWYVYEFQFAFAHDYPKVGVWPDGYYLSSQRGFPGGSLNAVVFDRANMLNGNPAAFQARTSAGPALTWLPSDLDGPTPPVGTPNFYSRQVDGDQWGGADRVEVMAFTVDWQNPVNSTFALVASLGAVGFDANLCAAGSLGDPCVPQPGTAQTLDTIPHWPMGPLQYRNFGTRESLVFNHTVDVDGTGHAGVRWYELRRPPAGAWTIFQQGTYSPDGGAPGLGDDAHRWMGSAGMDLAGNIAVGYSASDGTNVFPSVRYAGRLAGDPLGLLPHGEVTMVAGGGSQTPITCAGGNPCGNRWGDYSAIRVDPVDGCTFWYTQEYIAATSPGNINWRTRIGAFRFSSCNPADLRISKFDSPDPATAGEQLFYTIVVTNDGPAAATNVVVTDILSSGVTFITDTDSCTEAPAGTLTCRLTPGEGGVGGPANCANAIDDDGDGFLDLADPQCSMASGETRSFTVKVDVDSNLVVNAGGPTVITNTASVTVTQDDPDPTNNTATATTIVEDLADLRVTKECKPDEPLLAGDIGICKIFVDNLGPSHARDVILTDVHLSNGTFIIGAAALPGGVCPSAGGVVICDLGTEPAGGRTTITVTLHPDEAMDINDCATVESATPDPDTSNNQACDGITVRAVSDLSITKTDLPDPVAVGSTLTYTLGVTNSGPSTAQNVVVVDTLPGGVSLISFSPSQGSCKAGVPGDPQQELTCNLDSLAPAPALGSTATVTVVVAVPIDFPLGPGEGGGPNDNCDDTVDNDGDSLVDGDDPECSVIFNRATVSSDHLDTDNSDNVVSARTTVVPGRRADLEITKTSDADVYKASSLVTYTITVMNHGPSDAESVVVTDILPVEKRDRVGVFPSNGCSIASGTVTCSFGTVDAHTSRSFKIFILVKGNRGLVDNTATVTTSTFDPDPANNSDTKTVRVGTLPKP